MPPKSEHLFSRQSLLESVRSHPNPRVLLISAPTGYGKTVLASQIANTLGHRKIEHTMTIWQRDVTLLNQTAINLLTACFDVNVPQEDVSFTRLLNMLVGTDDALTYVIDDLHLVVNFHLVEKWLQELLDNLPPQMTLILSGQELPPLNWATFVHRKQIIPFGIEKLALSADDLQAAMPDLSLAQAKRLTSQFDGWITGITLALNIPQKQIMVDDESIEPQQLFQQMLISTFQDQSPDFQSFLMLSSTLDQVSEFNCREVLGLQSTKHHLTRLHNQQLFVKDVDNGGVEYHEVFREFLQRQLKLFDEEVFLQSHQKVAEWHHAQDNIGNAITHYITAENIENAVSLAALVTPSYFAEGKKEALLYFYELLKDDAPTVLILHCGMVYIGRRQYDVSQKLLRLAQQQYIDQENHSQAIRAVIELAFNDFRAGNYQATLQQLDNLDITYPDMELRRNRLRGLANLELGQFDLAIKYLQKAIDSLGSQETLFLRSNILQDLSEAYLRSGAFTQAGEVLNDAVALKRKIGNAADLALALNNLGHYWYRTGAYQDAIATLENGLDLVTSDDDRATAYLYWSLADVYRTIGSYGEAERYYNTARKIAGDEAHLYIGVMLSLAMMRCMQGYWHDAERILDHIAEPQIASVQSLMLKLLVAAVHAMIQQRDYAEVDTIITELVNRGASLKLADALGIYLLIGWQSENTNFIERGLKLTRSLDKMLWHSIASFVVNFPYLQHHLIMHSGFDELVPYFERFKVGNNSQQNPILSGTRQSLSIFTLGQDHITLDGYQVENWTVNFARELFIYLYLNGRKTRYDLRDEFWLDKTVEQAMASFHTTRNRIHTALGQHTIIYEEQFYRINDAFDINIDCDKFEHYVRRAHQLPLSDARTLDLLHRAVAIYKGDFLPHSEREWVLYRRQTYQGLYVDTLVRLGQSSELRVDYLGAIQYYESATEIEPFTEKLYKQIILCWGRLGRRDMMKITYRRLQQRLEEGIQMKPSRSMQEFYESLMNE